MTFLLRSPTVFDQDEVIQGYIKSGKAKLLKGDALVQDDVKHAWDEAANSGVVDLLVFTVGQCLLPLRLHNNYSLSPI